MYITNLTKTKLGITGKLVLAPKEVNRYVDDSDTYTAIRVAKLKAAKLVSVVNEAGLTKTGIKGTITKHTVGADIAALSKRPRSITEEELAKRDEKATDVPIDTPVEKEQSDTEVEQPIKRVRRNKSAVTEA